LKGAYTGRRIEGGKGKARDARRHCEKTVQCPLPRVATTGMPAIAPSTYLLAYVSYNVALIGSDRIASDVRVWFEPAPQVIGVAPAMFTMVDGFGRLDVLPRFVFARTWRTRLSQ
jgi:hypothetical protein